MLWMLLAGCLSPTLDGQAWQALDLWPDQPDTSCRTALAVDELHADQAGVAWLEPCGDWLGQARRLQLEGPTLEGTAYVVQVSGAGQAMAWAQRWEVVPAAEGRVQVRVWDGDVEHLGGWDEAPGDDWHALVELERVRVE